MKRDLDLARQLLFDIEAHGASCCVGTLRANAVEGADERVRYHLRLLIDAQLVKEVERTSAGVPCVRLTSSGHELLELARSDSAWRDACRRTQETTGGQSLTVIRALLTKWAVEAAAHRVPFAYHRCRPVYHRIENPRYNGFYYDREPSGVEPRIELVRSREEHHEAPSSGERFDWRESGDRDVYYTRYSDFAEPDRVLGEREVGVSLPVSLV